MIDEESSATSVARAAATVAVVALAYYRATSIPSNANYIIYIKQY